MENLDALTSMAGVSADVVEAVSGMLEPVVIDLEALAVNLKQMHWNVRGPEFIGVHELLDRLVGDVLEYADLAAERIVALGAPVDARLGTVADKATLPGMVRGFRSSAQTIAAAVAQVDAAISTTHLAIDGLGGLDPASQDVAIEIERGLVKDRWLLAAHNGR